MEQPSNTTSSPEIQHPDLPMKWHKLLIYFMMWLWVLAGIVNIADIYPFLLGDQSQVPLQAKGILWILFLGEILVAIYTVKVRFDLAGLKAKSPRELSYIYIANAALILLMIIFYNSNNIEVPSQNYTQIIINACLFFACRKYYLARDYLFVN